MRKINRDKFNLAYIVGIAIGDGNLTNPNGRATRLRITCDAKYPHLVEKMVAAIKRLLPENKVSVIQDKPTYLNIQSYSNHWESILGWKAGGGSKFVQKITVPTWIKENQGCAKHCLRGLFETDGSVYNDRGYIMANFTTVIPTLANDVVEMLKSIGYNPTVYRIRKNSKFRHTIRISKNTKKFIETINLKKH